MSRHPGCLGVLLLVLAAGCHAGTGAGVRPLDRSAGQGPQTGLASYYGPGFHGERTASGEIFNQNALVAAHRTLAFGTIVRVTNLENGKQVRLRIVDRGPYGRNWRKGTIIDVSKGAARRLEFVEDGLVRVRVEVLKAPRERR